MFTRYIHRHCNSRREWQEQAWLPVWTLKTKAFKKEQAIFSCVTCETLGALTLLWIYLLRTLSHCSTTSNTIVTECTNHHRKDMKFSSQKSMTAVPLHYQCWPLEKKTLNQDEESKKLHSLVARARIHWELCASILEKGQVICINT